MQQLNEPMATPQFMPLDKHLKQIGHYCGLSAGEFAIVEDSVLLDGVEMLGREQDIAPVVRRFTEHLLGVTVVLPGELPFQEENSLRQPIVAAGGSCYFLAAGETFGHVIELARDRMQRLHLAERLPIGVGVASGSGKRSMDALKSYTYTPEEQEALRLAYESGDESSSLLS
jgi:hypothetical protein